MRKINFITPLRGRELVENKTEQITVILVALTPRLHLQRYIRGRN